MTTWIFTDWHPLIMLAFASLGIGIMELFVGVGGEKCGWHEFPTAHFEIEKRDDQ